LYAAFGKENIEDGVWNQKNSDTHLSSELTDPRNGIFTGILVAELEEWNGTPFSFAGLSWMKGDMLILENSLQENYC
jgi:hypothetical protein